MRSADKVELRRELVGLAPVGVKPVAREDDSCLFAANVAKRSLSAPRSEFMDVPAAWARS